MAGGCFDCKRCLSHSETNTGSVKAKQEEIIFSPGIVLNQISFCDEEQIELIDSENKVILITFSKAKPIFGEAAVLRKTQDGSYCIDVVFNKKCFGDSNYLVIK